MGRIIAPRRKFDVYLTEFSYQTSPPDHEVGVPLGRQSRYMQQAAYLAWRMPRVRNLTQYQWRDEPVIARGRGLSSYSGWQSGLRYVNGKPKPAMRAFLKPFVIDLGRRGSVARFWGQVRPGSGVRTVTVLRLRPGQKVYRRWRRCSPTRAAIGPGACRSSGARSTASRGRRRARPRRTSRRQRLSGVVDLATDTARQWHASR